MQNLLSLRTIGRLFLIVVISGFPVFATKHEGPMDSSKGGGARSLFYSDIRNS